MQCLLQVCNTQGHCQDFLDFQQIQFLNGGFFSVYRDLFGDSLFESKVEAIKCISSLLQVLLHVTEIRFELFDVNCTDYSKLN